MALRTHLIALASIALGALLLTPAGSAAAGAAETMHFSVPASNGYTLQVKATGTQTMVSLWRADPAPRSVKGLRAAPKGPRGLRLSSTYFVTDSAEPGSIRADLGPLGRIDVRFQPSGETKAVEVERSDQSPPGCKPPRRLVRSLGTFTGTISFQGGSGFATVETGQVPGSIGPSAQRRCAGGPMALRRAPARERRRVEHVWVASDAHLAATATDQFSGGTSGLTTLLVSTEGEGVRFAVNKIEALRPGLTVIRDASVTAPRSSFSYEADLSAATLRPPAPFTGEATYSARRGRLIGDLALELPGVPTQPLTGPGFEVRIGASR